MRPAARVCAGHDGQSRGTSTTRKLVSPQVRYRHRKIHSLVGEFSQNLHIGNMVVEAVKHCFQPRAKNARLGMVGRPPSGAPQKIQRSFVLQ